MHEREDADRPATLSALLEVGQNGDAALLAPARDPLDYAGLRRVVAQIGRALRRRGVRRDDRVASILPNGPEAAAAFLGIACTCASAPLNPAYREDELRFYLGDLAPRLLVVASGDEGPGREVAQELGIEVAEIAPVGEARAGEIELAGAAGDEDGDDTGPGGGDNALVLHTSGTTSRPKGVPLTHANLASSAAHVAATLRLLPSDRCLNVMPLFHIHGLVAAVLASLRAGASVCCCPGFNALRFFAWLGESQATWYTAVPTMHQAILERAERNREELARSRLRFVRSSSASLPPRVMARLEAVFDAPVVEAYGMTEAAHQMACNPLPPGERRPGSVGPAAGPEVAIMDPEGHLQPPETVGEVVIRGPNVTPGYLANPAANAAAFQDGWFRTGDEGRLDADGYLWLTGRLKEIINRGGEKISPREVDEVLLDHPAVAQAVTFALPHEKLGEEVAAAIVARSGASLDERELRDFARARLAPFKVPRRFVLVDEIPKGPTGKLQRIGLAKRLGLA